MSPDIAASDYRCPNPSCGEWHFMNKDDDHHTCPNCGMRVIILGKPKRYTVILLEAGALTWVGVVHATGITPEEAFVEAKKSVRPNGPQTLVVATYFDGWIDEVRP